MGEGPEDVLLLHGLGGTKSSFFDTAAALSRRYRVHALDLPGFGGSSKPPLAPYDAGVLRPHGGRRDGRAGDRPRARGRQLDGRPRGARARARAPASASAASRCCAPPTAFVRRDWHPVVRVLRPELGLLPHSLGRGRIEAQFWSLFADRDLVDPTVADIAVDEFERIYRSAGARLAFLTAGAQHLPREAVRQGRLLPAAGAARAARDVRLVLARQADPAGLPAPRRALAALLRADPARRLRPRAPGRAARSAPTACSSASSPASTRSAARAGWRRRDRRPTHQRPRLARAPRAAGCGRRPRTSRRGGPGGAARLGARRASRASWRAGSRPPTSTSATRTTSARACRGCGCCPRCTSAARCAGSATCPRRAACCWSATTRAAT